VFTLLALPAGAAGFFEGPVGTKNGKVYHLYPAECSTARRINAENIVRFASAEEAERAGRHLCKTCEKIRAKLLAEKMTGRSDKKGGQTETARPGGDKPSATTRSADPEAPSSAVPQFARVKNILPGGTLELDVGEKVRLQGVVCPAGSQPLAKEAARFLEEQTRGRTVQLSFDSPACLPSQRDACGRLVAYLMPQPDGRDLGGELIFQGYAWLDREAMFDRQSEYARREEEAWRDQRGVWKPLEGEAGKQEVVTGRFAMHYHDAKCPHAALLTGKITMTLNEAKSRRLPPCPLYRAKRRADDGASRQQSENSRTESQPSPREK
jgi:endonuclease YncB( thermonuclease family)